ncbi:hypothetical protein V502_00025 [Pseudogymnoascus sp. VKM F-4520 (FW-2644)]|nr:hypothetical protein V502_00025 [Pseudogymnoascus sp. VKM F-4520 (FW-2644)]
MSFPLRRWSRPEGQDAIVDLVLVGGILRAGVDAEPAVCPRDEGLGFLSVLAAKRGEGLGTVMPCGSGVGAPPQDPFSRRRPRSGLGRRARVRILGRGSALAQNTLLAAEVRTLRKANEALRKRRRAKKSRVRQGGAFTVEDARDVLARRDAEEQVRREKCSREGGENEGQSTDRRCGTCGRTSRYALTCPEGVICLVHQSSLMNIMCCGGLIVYRSGGVVGK